MANVTSNVPEEQDVDDDNRPCNILYSNKISFRNLSYRFEKPKRKYILQDLYGDFVPGTLTAIMGPSGCGKGEDFIMTSNWVSRFFIIVP